MEEKKMTDEEIVNALDKTKQELANISPEDDDYDKLLTVKTIVDYCHDLIHRLQSENEKLESELKKELDEHEEFTKKAKAEIERLKEKFSISHYKDSWKNKFFKAQEEVERLTDTLNQYINGELINAETMGKIISLEKQVDELKFDKELLQKLLDKREKDIAKDLWNDITSYYFALRVLGNCTVELDKLAEFWHKRGVEVE